MKNKREQISKSVYIRLPEQLKSLTENFEGREKDIVLLSSLGVLSNCLPNIKGIYDGNDIYPHLYIIIIAPAASGKGSMNYSRLLIEPIHERILKESRQDFIDCQKSTEKKSNSDDCPNVMIKILPANISTSEMYSYLGSSKHGLIIIESEADTLSNMLKNDWSNYSDVLRKAFQHEPISISRKIEKIFEDIKKPRLAMLISGTPNQLLPLIQSVENGLFSRLAIYNFEEISDFKNVFSKKTKNKKIIFQNISKEIFNLYGKLQGLESSIEFSFTKLQEKKFLKRLSEFRTIIIDTNKEGFVSNLHRHGLIFFRIAMIISAIRNIHELSELRNFGCTDEDFILSLSITETLLGHSEYTYSTIDKGVLSIQDELILNSLNDNFTSIQAYDLGSSIGISKRTMIDKLQQLQRKRFIKRVRKGHYKIL